MLSEARGRQDKSSNDESYVGSEARFSERAAGGPAKMKPAAPSMRHAPTDAPRRELSKSVEFLEIGSLHQMSWP